MIKGIIYTLNPLSAEHLGANRPYYIVSIGGWQALFIGVDYDVPGYVNRALKG